MTSKSRWSARRGLLGLLIGAALVLLGLPLASASAAIVIEEPSPGQTTGAKPRISGTTEGVLPVKVVIHEGEATGATVGTLVAPLPSGIEGNWNVTAGPLASGEY